MTLGTSAYQSRIRWAAVLLLGSITLLAWCLFLEPGASNVAQGQAADTQKTAEDTPPATIITTEPVTAGTRVDNAQEDTESSATAEPPGVELNEEQWQQHISIVRKANKEGDYSWLTNSPSLDAVSGDVCSPAGKRINLIRMTLGSMPDAVFFELLTRGYQLSQGDIWSAASSNIKLKFMIEHGYNITDKTAAGIIFSKLLFNDTEGMRYALESGLPVQPATGDQEKYTMESALIMLTKSIMEAKNERSESYREMIQLLVQHNAALDCRLLQKSLQAAQEKYDENILKQEMEQAGLGGACSDYF